MLLLLVKRKKHRTKMKLSMRKYFADQNENPPIKINLACVFLFCFSLFTHIKL